MVLSWVQPQLSRSRAGMHHHHTVLVGTQPACSWNQSVLNSPTPFRSNHHKFPSDVDRLVFPPLPACLPASVIYGALRCCLPRVRSRQLWRADGVVCLSSLCASLAAGCAMAD